MAVKKATTVDDIKVDNDAPAPPSHEELVARVAEVTDPEMVADVKDVDYVKVKSPAGFVTKVPAGIVDSLLQSGYTKGK